MLSVGCEKSLDSHGRNRLRNIPFCNHILWTVYGRMKAKLLVRTLCVDQLRSVFCQLLSAAFVN